MAIQEFDVVDGAVGAVGIPSNVGLTLVAYDARLALGMLDIALATNAVVANELSPPRMGKPSVAAHNGLSGT